MKEQSGDIRCNPEEEVSNLMKLSSLLFELSHPWRLKVLLLIAEEGERHSYISKKLKISPQETTRHLTRLQDAKLIEKDVQGFFRLTNYGKAVLTLLPGFEFLAEIGEDLMTHTLDIPKEFTERIGELKSFERTEGVMTLFRRIELSLADAEKYMWYLSPEILMSAVPIISKNLERGLEFRLILPKNAIYPPEFETKSREHVRFLDEIKISIGMAEKSAGFCLPARDGKIDFSTSFGSRDEEFHKWCEDLFLYYWEKARPVKEF
ncbi:MAG: transcriptional regulator FilR1 domain-containing protein [Euryarchaeota archaeon]|nr:transcriptional regulator FilR1 domain-containing protein [Euryarchaeota archaeon]